MKKEVMNKMVSKVPEMHHYQEEQIDLEKYKLSDLIDIQQLQHLFQLQYNFTGLPVGLLDNEGNILVGVGWQDICMEFHRKNPDSEQLCRESDSAIKKKPGNDKYVGYKCKLGLWDYAIPVRVAGNHLGNLFFGQFFFDDDKEDADYFIRQAKKYDFDKKEYLGTLKKVPRLSKQKAEQIIEYYSGLADMITDQAYKNLLFHSEKESRELLKNIFNGADMPMFLISVGENSELCFLGINAAHEKLTGMKNEEVVGKTPEELPGISPEAAKAVRANYERCIREGKSIKYREMILMFGNEMHWLTTLTPLYNNEGKVYRIVGTSMHINELVETQRELEHHRNNLEKLVDERSLALGLSEKQYQIVFEDSPIGKSQTGIDGSLKINRAFSKITGYTLKDLQRKNWEDITHPNDIAESEKMFQELLEGKRSHAHVEKRFLHKKGHYFWADVHTALHRDEGGNPLFFINSISDISERKKMESRVKTSEEKYRSLFNNIMDGLAITKDRVITDCNETLLRMLGYRKKEVIGKPTSFFFASQEAYEAMGRAIKENVNRGSFFIQIELKTKSGKLFPAETGVFYIKDADGNVIDVIGIIRDISDRKKAEKALAQSEEKHRAIFESATDAFIIADERGRVVEANPSACNVYGYDYEEMMGKTAAELIHPDHHYKFPEMIRALKMQGHYKGETVDVRKDGSTFFTEIRGSLINFNNQNHILVIVRDVSKQKEINVELEKEKEFTDAVINALPGVFYLFDQKGAFLKWNKTLAELSGLTNKEVGEKTPLDFIAPHHREKTGAAIQSAFIKGNVLVEADFLAKDGAPVPFLFKARRIFRDGKPLLIGVGIDIVKRVKAEKERKKALADLNERMKEITCLYNINEVFRKTGANLQELLQQTANLIPSGWQYPENTAAEICFNGVSVRTSRREQSTKFIREDIVIDGIERGFIRVDLYDNSPEIRKNPFMEEERNLLHEIAFITGQFIDKREYEEALRQSEENLKSIIQHSPVPKLVITNDSNVELANEAFMKAMGFQPGEMPDFDSWWLSAVPDDEYREEITAQWTNAMKVAITENRVSDPVEVRLITENGNERMFNVVCSSLAGKVIAELTDLTERINAEKKLQELLIDLKRSNEELEQFAYVASHDLQEPLRMVSSYTQMLERRYKGQLDEKADKYIYYAVDGAKRMQRLINDLLDFSRVSTRAKEFQPVDFNQILESALKDMEIQIQEKKAAITFTHLPQLEADKSQIERLFLNLINNGLKFHKPGKKPEIHISAREEADHWLFKVKDNGIGIDPDYKEKVFVIFQKLHNSEKYAGTGIGLAICKRIANRHGGKIWFKSKPGEGTTFYFTVKK